MEIKTIEDLKLAFPDLCSQIAAAATEACKAEGHAAGIAEGMIAGAESERKRISAMETMLIPGHEDLLKECKADATCTPEAFAAKQIAAEQALRSQHLANITSSVKAVSQPAAPEPGKDALTESDAVDPNLPVEDRAKAEWDKSPDLRAEFGHGGFNAYLAYKKATEAGHAKILKK